VFNRGVDELLQALPQLGELNADDVRRMLTRAWLEAVDRRDLGGGGVDGAELIRDLRRLATALELHAILVNSIDAQTIRASAFVAAEALEVVAEVIALAPEEPRPWLFGTHSRFERVEAGLLYLIAGYDANAALIGQDIDTPDYDEDADEAAISTWVLQAIRALLLLRLPPNTPVPPVPRPDRPLRERVRHAIWTRLGDAVRSHMQWLTLGSDDGDGAIQSVRDLIAELERQDDGQNGGVQHADLHHLALLLAAAMDGTGSRALRAIPPPPHDGGRFEDFQRQRASTRPLLWPAAAEYAELALPGPHAHAVVSVPTGAGKSAVAELAIAQAVRDGWVLYLSPTNALAGQIRRQLNEVIGQLPGVTVREFVGGAEYTELEGEDLGIIGERQILVMTPEKCSLALRQNPEAFGRMAFCVIDEAHILGEPGARAVIAELALSEVLHRAPQARVLMLSALLANPADIASWLQDATRTLRAIAGFDLERSNEAAERAVNSMQALPAHRKNITFNAPLALFAGLQGAWRTSELVDFAFVPTTIEAPVKYHRDKGYDFDGYLNPTVQALVQGLGEHRHRVLAFLPRNKHYSFLAARAIPGFTGDAPVELGPEINALLVLADAELGAPSALRDGLGKRVGVHTSAMLQEERRASELALEREVAWVIFATGTMAQGLNLPATAVVIGGTKIGWDRSATSEQERQRERAQLLNAIGRAGRANVAPRSMAIVVPDKVIAFSTETDAATTIRRADFLREEDASTEINSQLDGLIARALDGTLDMPNMSSAEQTAFAFLSYAAEGNDAQGVLRRSWAVQRAAATAQAEEIARVLGQLGSAFLDSRLAPEWVALAAHRSGLALPETAGLYSALRQHLSDAPLPTTIRQWADTMIAVLRTMLPDELERVLPSKPYESTRLAPIWREDIAQRNDGWAALQATLTAWFEGQPLLQVAAQSERKDPTGKAGRGPQDPLPRTLRVVNEGFGFGLAIVAGALGAIVAAGRETDREGPWPLPADSARALALLPLAVRFGAGSSSTIAWMRAGARPRVVAHLLDRLIEAPSDMDDEDLRSWASRQLKDIADEYIRLAASDEERALISAMLVGRRTS
jgi:superfamily II DNA/RNA helicase